jgi:hypothetical protein
MEANPQPRSIDLTGLPDEAVRVVESLVGLLRGQPRPNGPAFSSPAAWANAIREWAASHAALGASADWSRESIYAGHGEWA